MQKIYFEIRKTRGETRAVAEFNGKIKAAPKHRNPMRLNEGKLSLAYI